MSGIVIGKSDGKNVSIDRKLLMSTRLLITSDSGGGKTHLLKRLIEQSFGDVGIIVIDPEGEFAPLRTKFDFFLVGKGGDTPADIRTAEKVARTLLSGRASAVCDIYEMPASERHVWVQRFLDALLDAPKELRHPYFVIVDEAHMFCPEHGKGESVAADAMRGLATRGRKRMLCGIYATQRLASLSKDLTGMCLNRLVGPTFETINQKRGADELGIPKPEQAEFFKSVKMLEPGNFYALGRAITKEIELVHIGAIETPHGHDALKYELKPPPPTEKVREWLKKLGDLPKQAEEEARTTADFKKQIRDLKAELSKRPNAQAISEAEERCRNQSPIAVNAEAIRLAVAASQLRNFQAFEQKLRGIRRRVEALSKAPLGAFDQWRDEALTLVDMEITGIDALRKQISGEKSKKGAGQQNIVSVSAFERAGTSHQQVTRPKLIYEVAQSKHRAPSDPNSSDGAIGGPERRILRALSELVSIGKLDPPKEMVAAWSGYSPNGGAFQNPLGKLNTSALVRRNSGLVAITDAGLELIGRCEAPDQKEVKRRILAILDGPKRRILQVLIDQGKDVALAKDSLAEQSGYAVGGGAFQNPLGALRTAGFVDYPEKGFVKAADWIFVD